jgi:hypothetical protein
MMGRTSSLLGVFLVLSAGLPACAAAAPQPVRYGRVVVTGADAPEGREVLGNVEISGQRKLSELVREFAERVAVLGGTVGRIDSFSTTPTPETRYSSSVTVCGIFPRNFTCYRGTEHRVPSVVTTLRGRAFR